MREIVAMVLLALVGVTDLRRRRIPNAAVAVAAAIGVAAAAWRAGAPGAAWSLAGAAAGALWWAAVPGLGLGAGDAKLAMALGALLGPWVAVAGPGTGFVLAGASLGLRLTVGGAAGFPWRTWHLAMSPWIAAGTALAWGALRPGLATAAAGFAALAVSAALLFDRGPARAGPGAGGPRAVPAPRRAAREPLRPPRGAATAPDAGRPAPRRPAPGAPGQATAFAALVLALVLVGAAAGAVGVAMEVAARADLAQAAEAAALAEAGREGITAVLEVRFAVYACTSAPPAAPARGGSLQAPAGRYRRGKCTGPETGVTRVLATGADFAGGAAPGPLGPDPGWARAAGCQGTRWPGGSAVPGPGTWRICVGQGLLSAVPTAPGDALGDAERWVEANTAADPLLAGARVAAVRVGPQGQVTVTATAALAPWRVPLARLRVVATAWPRGVRT